MASDIAEWYRGKAVFITGATGFMGKVLVEKLLRSCPDIGTIYVLMRTKKNVPPRDRLDKIMRSTAFEDVRAKWMDRKDWLHPIPGELGLPDLGISAEDRRLLQDKVSVVFHLAATVRFDERLPVAMAINFDGTRALLELCLGMTSLCAFVHVSTAYSNCPLSVIEERVYPPPADPSLVKNSVAFLSDDLIELVTPKLIGDYPNTYTFTKALTEHEVAQYSIKLPIVIVRPSIVSAAWKEPIPGWIDSFNGPAGYIASASMGFLKCVYGNGQLAIDLIPVDICINLFIAAAWEMGVREHTKLVPNVRVYNCVSRPFKPLFLNEFVLMIHSCIKKFTTGSVFMSPKFGITSSRINFALYNLEQTVVATLADVWIKFLGGTPRFQRYQAKIKNMTMTLEYFLLHEYQFDVENVKELKHRMNCTDQIIFNSDVTDINWKEYVTANCLGIREYLMNEKNGKTSDGKNIGGPKTRTTESIQGQGSLKSKI